MDILIIGLIILCGSSIFFLTLDDVDFKWISIMGIILGTTMVIFGLETYDMKPIDVYRGNTELKIKQEIVNNEIVKQDTIVIWKKEKLK